MSFYGNPYPPPPVATKSDKITISGDRFAINGFIQHVRGFTDFQGLEYWIRTGKLSPLALQIQELHQDFVSLSVPVLTPRILCTCANLFKLDPRTIPDYFGKLAFHAKAMNEAGFIPLYTLLADCQILGMDQSYQTSFVEQACAFLSQHNCLVELANEYQLNGVNPLAFSKPAGVIISRGSPNEMGDMPTPPWDFMTWRARRDYKWLSTIQKDENAFRSEVYPDFTGPIFDSEPRGAGDGTENHNRYTNPSEGFVLGLNSAIAWKAGFFHSQAGLTSSTLSPTQMNCAICFFRGMFVATEIQIP